MTSHRVEVPGGALAAHVLTVAGEADVAMPGRPTVIAIHGITANAMCWRPLADRLAGAALVIAPDLRGRAASADTGPPHGLRQHAADVWSVADTLAAGEQITVVGHSMGAYVAAMAAALHPRRVRRLVLLDGGLPLGLPALVHRLPDRVLMRAGLGPALQRLDRTFDSPQEYLAYWHAHPAVGPLLDGPDAAAVAAYLEHDLRALPAADGSTAWRSSCDKTAVMTDGRDIIAGVGTEAAGQVARAGVPVSFTWAGRGLQNQRRGLYRRRRLDRLGLPGVDVRLQPAANHYSLVFGPFADRLARDVLSDQSL